MNQAYSKIHPELQLAARMAPKFTYSKRNLWILNWLMRILPKAPVPRDVAIENVCIPRENTSSKIRIRIYKPKSDASPVPGLLWMHGGGYVMGLPEQDETACAQYVHELGIKVFSVDYRHAPEYPFPAGLNDCYAALEWVTIHAQQLGVDANRLAIGGASAGGGLAASLAQLLFDRQGIKPVFQLLVYPMLDDRTVLRQGKSQCRYIAWNQESNRFGWESYLGMECGAADVPPYSVPARRQNLSGLPNVWIGVGTEDLFYDEDRVYAERLMAHGVRCELNVVTGAFHGFDVFNHQLEIVKQFRQSQIGALRQALFT